ncbi:TerD family protein [Streptomyces sp. NPDC012888]|uniref:TerD family protein n=1 Tax=Streptomyces sp. NPDC012888 TaxID=3364855 RepID=UPI0036C35F87
MSGVSKGLRKVEVALKWDPSPLGAAPHDLDIVAAVYGADDPHGTPVHLVHFGNRAPDGTITLDRDSRTGQGFGFDEVMTLELDRMAPALRRVVVGVVVQREAGEEKGKTFRDVPGTVVRIREGHRDLMLGDFRSAADASAATVAEFARDSSDSWQPNLRVRGFAVDPEEFVRVMGRA